VLALRICTDTETRQLTQLRDEITDAPTQFAAVLDTPIGARELLHRIRDNFRAAWTIVESAAARRD
jgi:hypothetical protein